MRELTHESAGNMILLIDRQITSLEGIIEEMRATRQFLAQFID